MECRREEIQKPKMRRTPVTVFLMICALALILAFLGGSLIGKGSARTEEKAEPLAIKIQSPVSKPLEEKAGEAGVTPLKGMPPSYDITRRAEHPPIEDGQKEAYVSWMLEHTQEQGPFLRQRWDRSRACKTMYTTPDLSEPRVIEAFLRTPREIFARPPNANRAYDNAALPVGWGQTISGPHMVSRMTNTINPEPHHRVLEIGTGSGYQSAVLAQLTNFVFTIEIVEPLARDTDTLYTSLEPRYPEYRNIKRKIGDGYYGWEEYAPFNRIIVTAGIDHIPPPLLNQLAPDGIMVIPIGPPSGQTVLKITKSNNEKGETSLTREDIYQGTQRGNVIFVPFTDESGRLHSKKKE